MSAQGKLGRGPSSADLTRVQAHIQGLISERIRLEPEPEPGSAPIELSQLTLLDLFDLDTLQEIQDAFSDATGVASIITQVNGDPITRPSNFCRLCQLIRSTEQGLRNCKASDAQLGRPNPEGPIIQTCLSGGLWDGGASISVGGRHIANWLIGQVRDETQSDARLLDYAREIGADEAEFTRRLAEVPRMSLKRFGGVGHALFLIANMMSEIAFQSLQKTRLLKEIEEAERERRLLEAQVRHTQKLESLGVLAGGIAHDFNNLLQAIMGNVDIALLKMDGGGEIEGHLSEVKRASRRASDLCQQLLAYSGRGRFEIKATDLNALVRETSEILKVSVSKKARLRLELEEVAPVARVDATQIRQVLMNLLTNASEALEGHSGAITLATRRVQLEGEALEALRATRPLSPGPYALIQVSDTGCGMPAEVLERLFDPFFTTKFTGRGLGMSAVLGIIQGHRGGLSVESTPGVGTTFRVYIPAVEEATAAARAVEDEVEWSGEGVALIVDDDAFILDLGGHMLELLGFEVLTAEDGAAALEILEARGGELACIVCDQTMPEVSGTEVLHAARQIAPQAPFVLSSGFDQEDVAPAEAGGPDGFLKKPYLFEDMRRCLRCALELARS